MKIDDSLSRSLLLLSRALSLPAAYVCHIHSLPLPLPCIKHSMQETFISLGQLQIQHISIVSCKHQQWHMSTCASVWCSNPMSLCWLPVGAPVWAIFVTCNL